VRRAWINREFSFIKRTPEGGTQSAKKGRKALLLRSPSAHSQLIVNF
jgi:hypothetical protein